MFVIMGEISQAMLFDIGSVMEPAVYVHGRIVGFLKLVPPSAFVVAGAFLCFFVVAGPIIRFCHECCPAPGLLRLVPRPGFVVFHQVRIVYTNTERDFSKNSARNVVKNIIKDFK